MLRKYLKTILFLPLFFNSIYYKPLLSQTKDNIDLLLNEEQNKLFIDYSEIKNILLEKNPELKSLKKLISSASFNLASNIAKRYPTLNLQSMGLPKYVAGKNYNSNSPTTKTSQFSLNPTLNLRLDLINPLRGAEIKIAKNNYEIARNNYEIKMRDLVQEAKSRYHKFQKSHQEIKNKQLSLNLSKTSLKDALSKFDAGIGTKFEVLEAEAQLSRDKQSLNTIKIEHKINKISLKEILNIQDDFGMDFEQKLIGFWNYKLNKNINNGLSNNLSLKNISLKKLIKQNQAENYLNANKPNIYISNAFSSSFSKGDSLSTEIDSSESGSNYTNTISLNIDWNIFDGGKNNNSYKSSKADSESEDYSYNSLANSVKTKITKTYLNLNLNQERILSSLKEISSTNESLRLARLRYDVGISTLKDVLVRQQELSNAKSKNIDAIYNYNLNLDELERLTFLEISNNCFKKESEAKNKHKSICDISQ